jgi:hypothetical protein
MKALNTYLDHTLLKADATAADILAVTTEAKQYHTASVCVNSCYASLVARELTDSGVKTCVVVGFPLGAMSRGQRRSRRLLPSATARKRSTWSCISAPQKRATGLRFRRTSPPS